MSCLPLAWTKPSRRPGEPLDHQERFSSHVTLVSRRLLGVLTKKVLNTQTEIIRFPLSQHTPTSPKRAVQCLSVHASPSIATARRSVEFALQCLIRSTPVATSQIFARPWAPVMAFPPAPSASCSRQLAASTPNLRRYRLAGPGFLRPPMQEETLVDEAAAPDRLRP